MKARPHSENSPAGFSLVEMLVTLALLSIMAVMLYGFGSASHQRTQKELCHDNLQKIYLAMQIYANDFGGTLPFKTNVLTSEDVLDELVPHYTADTTIFICPGGRDALPGFLAALRAGYYDKRGKGAAADVALFASAPGAGAAVYAPPVDEL